MDKNFGFGSGIGYPLGPVWNTVWDTAVQKIKKLSETPGTVPIVAKLCMIDTKNREIAEKLVQPVTPHLGFSRSVLNECSKKMR